ncbi:MAG: hypothetical protein QNJ32_00680 [Xenococcaceae cyanobacterium MO_167.B27]|nr:hypothetical protein [Xenococcaceae cyanobacterium MO_167.B27]
MTKLNGWLANLLINRDQLNNSICLLFLILLGITLPFLLVTNIDSYFRGDINVFHSWANCWSHKIYVACQPKIPPNYPVAGLTLSAGLIHTITSIFDITERNTSDMIFRYYLAFFDSLNFLLFIWLASLMRFRFPIIIGFILLIIPSTWVGGAIWGQIDGIALFFCLLSTICFFKSWLTNDIDIESVKVWKSTMWLLLGNLSLSLYILTKQLAIFSLPFFFLLYMITVWKFWKNFHYRGLLWVFLTLFMFIFFFRYIDSLFEVPGQFHNSSYWFVWTGGGSEHGNKISGNGFNIWMFLGRDMWSSSRTPFFTLKLGNWKDDIAPYQAGIFLYSIFTAFLLFICCKCIWTILNKKIEFGQRDKADVHLIALLCFFHGLSHLGFNVLLTGTHERYLYLGYPFLLIAVTWFYTNKIAFSWQLTISCFFAAFAYGCFVFSMTGPLPKLLFPLQRHEFLASIHVFLLIFLLERSILVSQLGKKNSKVVSDPIVNEQKTTRTV